MNNKIIIKTLDGNILFNGNILDIPIKEDYIIKKSIEIFDDDDPCIIHKSFVIKKIVEELLEIINNDGNEIKLIDYKNKISFLNIDNYDECILYISE